MVSRSTAAELMRVLHYPEFHSKVAEQQELLGDYLPFAEVVAVPDNMSPLPRSKDPDDQMFLEVGVAGDADLIVTGDPDLLELSRIAGIAIVTPAEAARRLHR